MAWQRHSRPLHPTALHYCRHPTDGTHLLMALICVIPRPALAATDGMVRVTLKEGQSLQDLARQYLGDPNLWTEIPKASGLASVPEAKPGVELRVPVTQVSSGEGCRIGARLYPGGDTGRSQGLRR